MDTLGAAGRTGWFSLPGVSLVVKEKRIAPKAPAWSPLHGLAVPHLAFEIGGRPFGPKSVLVVDEAGMVGTRQLRELLDHAAAARAKVVLVGDARQLPAIEAGAPFRALQDRLGAAGLEDIRRQREPWARDVVRDLAEGRAERALGELDGAGASGSATAAASSCRSDSGTLWPQAGRRSADLQSGAWVSRAATRRAGGRRSEVYYYRRSNSIPTSASATPSPPTRRRA